MRIFYDLQRNKNYFTLFKIAVLLIIILNFVSRVPIFGSDTDTEPKQILIFYSHSLGTPWQDSWADGFNSMIKSNNEIKTNILSDFPWISNAQDAAYEELLIEFYRHKYKNQNIDVLVSTSTASTLFLLEFSDSIFPEVPVVALPGSDSALLKQVEKLPNWTGAFSEKKIKESLDLAMQLLPGTENIALISGSTINGKNLLNKAIEVIANQYENLNTINLTDISMDEVLEQVAALPPDTVILYLITLMDSTGKEFIPKVILNDITAAANAPVLGLWDTLLGSGVLGGSMVSPEFDGKSIAKIVERILEGEEAKDILISKTMHANYFDWLQIKKWGIKETALPENSIIINKEYSFWKLYRLQIIFTVLIIILEAGLIILLLIQRSSLKSARGSLLKSQKELEYKVLVRTEALSKTNQQLKKEILDHQDARVHIQHLLEGKDLLLREVHHRIKNNMSTLIGILSMQTVNHENPEAEKILEDAGQRIHSMMILYDKLYRGSDYQNIPVQDYFKTLINEIATNFKINNQIRIETEIEDFVLDSVLIFNIGIILNELITNIMKYAFTDGQDCYVRISITQRSNHVKIIIKDNGVGIGDDFDIESTEGFGLKLVNLLVKQIKGILKIENKGGTILTLSFERKV